MLSEQIEYNGKRSRIDYKYVGTKLVSADCGEDDSLDGRAREVLFAAN